MQLSYWSSIEAEWNSVLSSATLISLGDSRTYRVINLSAGSARMVDELVVGTYPLNRWSWGISTGRTFSSSPTYTVNYQDFSLNIPIDANWIPFQEHLRMDVNTPQNVQIEINVFKSGATTPEFSYRIGGGMIVTSVSTGLDSYSLSLAPQTVGYKHHPSGSFRAFNVITGVPVSY